MLELKQIYKDYYVDKKPFAALKNINIAFGDKGFVAILGPSGCGKTTLLNLIGGLDHYTKGDLLINGKSTKKFGDADWDAYRNKRIGFVFQAYNLVPHLTVLGNVELSMTLNGLKPKERHKRAMEALTKVGLRKMVKKLPNQLSGGQMQRVALARALVNNPEIILADEPTGALDSATSIQVMDLLAEVAKTRLVIMVTHNQELADEYSDRIVSLYDGRVVKDTNPVKIKKADEGEKVQEEKNKHTHMSFFTALGSSARNLLTKKGRTVMTSVAASFGIIGVALILAMSNGFTNYVDRIQAATASTVPITIAPYVTNAIKEIDLPEPWPEEEVIKPYDQDITQIVSFHRNRITNSYANYCRKLLENPQKYASSVLENHEYLDFNVFTERADGSGGSTVIKVEQFDPAGAGATILSGTTGLPSTIFHELYGNEEYIRSLYDVVYGKYPSNKMVEDQDGCWNGEVCLVCDRYNRIPMETLYKLGLSSTAKTVEGQTITFESLMNHTYKSYLPDVTYKAIEKDNPVTVTIPKTDYYVATPDTESGELKLSEPSGDKTIKTYLDVAATDDGGSYIHPEEMKALYASENDKTNKPMKLKVVGIIRPSHNSLVNLMPGSICYPSVVKEKYIDGVTREESVMQMAEEVKANYYIPRTATPKDFNDLITLACLSSATGDTTLLREVLAGGTLLRAYPYLSNSATTETFKNQYSFKKYINSNYCFASKLFNEPVFYDYIKYEGFKAPLKVKMDSISGPMDVLSYVDGYSTISSLLVFPKTFADKQRIFTFLDAWNEGKEETNQIVYSDIAGNLTVALGNMINITSIVLIVFSSVSLLVSCVMTGIITYTSVLERTKEIGLLRAIGARKKDVGRLFEAESVIIGAAAGIIGIAFTFIVEWPISLIIGSLAPEQNIGLICNLHPLHALGLVAISILLTFISGFIPARHAAKKDPVVALRSE